MSFIFGPDPNCQGTTPAERQSGTVSDRKDVCGSNLFQSIIEYFWFAAELQNVQEQSEYIAVKFLLITNDCLVKRGRFYNPRLLDA